MCALRVVVDKTNIKQIYFAYRESHNILFRNFVAEDQFFFTHIGWPLCERARLRYIFCEQYYMCVIVVCTRQPRHPPAAAAVFVFICSRITQSIFHMFAANGVIAYYTYICIYFVYKYCASMENCFCVKRIDAGVAAAAAPPHSTATAQLATVYLLFLFSSCINCFSLIWKIMTENACGACNGEQ